MYTKYLKESQYCGWKVRKYVRFVNYERRFSSQQRKCCHKTCFIELTHYSVCLVTSTFRMSVKQVCYLLRDCVWAFDVKYSIKPHSWSLKYIYCTPVAAPEDARGHIKFPNGESLLTVWGITLLKKVYLLCAPLPPWLRHDYFSSFNTIRLAGMFM